MIRNGTKSGFTVMNAIVNGAARACRRLLPADRRLSRFHGRP
jgi:hypothetical protein